MAYGRRNQSSTFVIFDHHPMQNPTIGIGHGRKGLGNIAGYASSISALWSFA
jgi:hypothetical protein